jgi:hypothetical protein
MSNKFKKPELNPNLTPVDWFNFFGDFKIIFEHDKKCIAFSDNSATYFTEGEVQSKTPTFELNKNGLIDIKKSNPFDLPTGSTVSKFMLLSAVKFKYDNSKAQSFVLYFLMKKEIPYIRVGTDHFNVFEKTNRYGINQTVLKSWDKATINDDHGKSLLTHIPKFQDFTIIPNNKDFIPVANNCYNLYSKFSHEPFSGNVSLNDIPITIGVINHIFGEQWQLGLKYMKILYEYPQQILPVLSLVSTERQTGKTTFLNYLQILFGENATLINPGDLTSNYNDAYATKNIIMIDETVIDRANTIEKLKSIATAKTMSVSQKFVQHYSVPFFGKVIICTNKETDFMRIDEEEIRFWVRKIKPVVGERNTLIEEQLRDEIPKFLKILIDLPQIDFSKSRMVFTEDEIQTTALDIIKKESKTGLVKELEMHIEDYFNNSDFETFEATAKDIKERWFDKDNQTKMSYIFKTLTQQMNLKPQNNKWFIPFNTENPMDKKKGIAFLFERSKYCNIDNQVVSIYDEKDPF